MFHIKLRIIIRMIVLNLRFILDTSVKVPLRCLMFFLISLSNIIQQPDKGIERANARIEMPRAQRIKHGVSQMRAALFAVGCRPLSCWSAPFRRAEHRTVATNRVRAD